MIAVEDGEILKILKENENIAVIGCSRNEKKEAHKVPKFLQSEGYRIIPMNPFADEILGEKSYESLSEISKK